MPPLPPAGRCRPQESSNSNAFEALPADVVIMIYVVVGNRLLFSTRESRSEDITHAAIASGRPVQAAGEFEFERDRGTITVSMLNNMSGHYRPAASSLAVAREAFETRGFPVRPDNVRHHDWRAP